MSKVLYCKNFLEHVEDEINEMKKKNIVEYFSDRNIFETFLNIYACASLSSTSNREIQMTKDGCSSVLHIPSVFHIYSKFSIHHNTFLHSIQFPNEVRLIKVSNVPSARWVISLEHVDPRCWSFVCRQWDGQHLKTGTC